MAITRRGFRLSCVVICAASVAVAIFVRLRFLEFPLERDEGEYAYAGQLLLRGIPPYQLAYNMKFPGAYCAYAVIMAVFGQSISAIHLGLLLVNLATIGCVFLVGRKLANTEAGLLGAAFYALLSLSPWVAGLCGHASHFVVLAVMIGTAILLGWRVTAPTSILAGVFFGMAILMKQPGALFLPFGCVVIACSRTGEWKGIAARIVIFLAGAATPIVTMLLLLACAGVLRRFQYWSIDYAVAYGTLISPREGLRALAPRLPQIIGGDWLIWALATAGAAAAACVPKFWSRRGILLTFFICSVAAVCPGFYFREHYFIVFLPAIALAAAVTLTRLATLRAARISAGCVAVIALALPLYRDRELLFRTEPATASRLLYWPSPFVEAFRVSNFVREHTTATDTIAVLGSEPEIYFYAQRLSATGYIYTYALMEPQARASEMQREMIDEIERARPKFIIVIGSEPSWLRRATSDQTLFEWANNYCGASYSVAGLVNLVSPQHSEFFLPLDISAPPTLAENYVLIYERRTSRA